MSLVKRPKKRDLDHIKTFKGEIMVIVLGALWTINQHNTPGCGKVRWNLHNFKMFLKAYRHS